MEEMHKRTSFEFFTDIAVETNLPTSKVIDVYDEIVKSIHRSVENGQNFTIKGVAKISLKVEDEKEVMASFKTGERKKLPKRSIAKIKPTEELRQIAKKALSSIESN